MPGQDNQQNDITSTGDVLGGADQNDHADETSALMTKVVRLIGETNHREIKRILAAEILSAVVLSAAILSAAILSAT